MSGKFIADYHGALGVDDWYSAMYNSPPGYHPIHEDLYSRFLFDQAMARPPPPSVPMSYFHQKPQNGISELYTERFRGMINQSNNEQNFLRETWDNIIKLMEHGADPRIKNNDGDNILHIAIKQNVDSSILYQLLKWCYFILNDINVEGYTPIDLVERLYGKDSVLWRQLYYQATTTPHY